MRLLIDVAAAIGILLAARLLVYRVLWPRFGVTGEQAEATMSAAGMSTEPAHAGRVPAEQDDSLEKLKKLGELRDAGVLSEEEFSQAKQRVLKELS
jgi:Short C-terminal domain